MKPLLTSYLHKKRISVVRTFLKGDVLDLGCGSASIIQFLNKNQNYVGIEYDNRCVEDLKRKYPTYNFYTRDLEKDKLNIKGFKFDTILMIAVIEHLAHPDNIISECRKYLKPNSSLFITTPTSFGNNIIHKLGAKFGLFSKVAVKDHKIIYDYKKMKFLLNKYRLKIVKHKKFEFGCNSLFEVKIK